MNRHFLSIVDLTSPELMNIVQRGAQLAAGADVGEPLKGMAVGIFFRKTSTRTRTSFTVAVSRLGGVPVTFGPNDLQINAGESIEDTARVLAGYLNALVIRSPESADEAQLFARQSSMSIVNAMSAMEHPTQALADLTTLVSHFGHLEGLQVLYLGEGNNTVASLALAFSRIRNARLTVVTPEGYGLEPEILCQCREFCGESGASIETGHDVNRLPRNVDVVYTTRWETTGTVKRNPHWRVDFAPFCITPALMERVSKRSETVFMHDLPAIRGEDVLSDVLDGPSSIAFTQAQNKLYAAMAVLEWCVQRTEAVSHRRSVGRNCGKRPRFATGTVL